MISKTYFFFDFFSTILVTGTSVVIDCYSTTVDNYIGHQQTTRDGIPCRRWDSNVLQVYKNEQFRDATVSDAANFCRNVGKNYIWCWTSNRSDWDICGIDKCDNNGINKCGNLKIEQPALLRRNVTFTFTPDAHDPDAILEWQRTADAKRYPWYTRPLTYKFTQYNENGTYYMVLTNSLLKVDEVYYRIHYYNESMHCWMEAGKLEIDDRQNNSCGYVYLRNDRVLEGENVYLEYYPSKDVMENPDNFKRTWARSRNGYTSYIKLLENDIYIENKNENGIYILTISMVNSRMNGRYGVYCGRETGYTNNVSVVVQVPPSAPEFVGLQDIDECKKCIVGSDKENIQVHCKTSGGTPPVDVTVTVGDKSFQAMHHDVDRSFYKAFITLTDSYHNATITCSVMNDALSSPLLTTAQVYVIKPPTNVLLVASSDLKEGSPVHILCLSQSSRPSPMVYLNVSGIKVSSADVDTSTTFDQVTSLYSNFITLTAFKREWHGKNIVCCSFNKWYNAPSYCSQPKQVNFVFPPSDIKLEIKFDSVDPLHMYAVCTLNNSNPACTANFLAASISIGSERNSINMSLPHGAWKTEYVVNLNVSKEDNGKDVTCAAECADFQDLELRDTKKIKLPWNKKQMSEMSDEGNGTLIGIIVGICSALVVIVVVIVVVIKKTRDNDQDQPSQERNSLRQRFVYFTI
ncbi:uncharacterized protein LOC132737046 [Ruditapes philippinarum]|uniref:uncharacterized protein LOC132737046 n=1 Tax=Ruditapes philippinarum TaxID=129788 RepID=UPI00295B9940|nr:uncharacterized protein LOC132737046 [Ruditapes philippinarum]